MISLLEAILMGIWATFFMDILAIVFGKLKIIRPTIEPQIVGRWALYIFRGKIVHKDIYKTPALANEKIAALVSHYLIGIILAGIYLIIELKVSTTRDLPWMALIFGLLTVLLPWLWLFPSIGIGFLASKTAKKTPYIVTSLINHTDFGLGLVVWIVAFRRLFT